MSYLQRLRDAPRLMRWVLLWFALSIGVAVASPLVKPTSLSLICSASGNALVDSNGTPAAPSHAPSLDCVLCLPMAAPPASPARCALAEAPAQLRPLTAAAPVGWRIHGPTSARDPPHAG